MSTPRYTTLADLKAFRPSRSTAALTWDAWTDSALTAMLVEIENWFDAVLGDRFDQWDETIYANGNGKHKLFLPQDASWPYRLRSVTSCLEIDFAGGTVRTLVEATDFQAETHFLRTDETVPTRARSAVGGRISIWPIGVKNIKIEGSWGWEEVPEEIQRAVYLLAIVRTLGEAYAGFSTASGDRGVASQRWDDYSVSYEARKKNTDGTISATGFREIDRLLTPYLNITGLFHAP